MYGLSRPKNVEDLKMKHVDETYESSSCQYLQALLVPNSYVGKGENLTTDDLRAMIPQEHRDFRSDILEQYDLQASDLRSSENSKELESNSNGVLGAGLDGAKEVLEVAFAHPISLVANALGVPPKWMLEMGKEHNVPVAALVGAKQHAVKQAEAHATAVEQATGRATAEAHATAQTTAVEQPTARAAAVE